MKRLLISTFALLLPACSSSPATEATCSRMPVSMPAVSGDTVAMASGLKYILVETGSGSVAEPGRTITVDYAGYLQDGREFDAGRLGFTVGMRQVVPGFDEGVKGMLEGEQRRLIVPAELGYGARPQGCIPPNSTLIFDVDLVDAG